MQLSIDYDQPRARLHDPATSHRAAASARKFSESHAGRIRVALIGLKQGTAEAIAFASGLTVVQIDRRTHEMERDGLIRLTGRVVGGFREWEACA